jgi:phosphoglycerate dehydrogenase-like enzyme
MKLVYVETPATASQSHEVDDTFIPEGIEHSTAVFNPAESLDSDTNRRFVAGIKDADIIINSYVDFQKDLLDVMDHCRVISFQSTGYNAADLDYAAKKGVAVVSILDYCTQETAENAIANMMALQRNTVGYNTAIQVNRVWDYSLFPGMKRVQGQTISIIGFGRIGQRVAHIAGKGLDMKVLAFDPFVPAEVAKSLDVTLVDMDTALAEGDVVSVHMNLTKDNKNMFNKETFAKMKKHPIFVNEGRGEMVVLEDLKWALDNKVIRAAAVDMLDSEDPDLSKCCLIENPPRTNLIINPHSGYWSDTSDYLVRKYSMENAINYVNGNYDEVRVIRNGVKA